MRVKVGKFVVRHNKKEYGENDVFEIDTEGGERLISKGVAKETSEAVSKKETEAKADTAGAVSIENLTIEIVNGLKQKELLAVKKEMELDTVDNKAATLRATILEAISEEEVNLDSMVEKALRALAAEEDIILPEDADEEAIRDILAEALA